LEWNLGKDTTQQAQRLLPTPTCYRLAMGETGVMDFGKTCYGKVVNSLQTCYGGTGVMDFGLNSAKLKKHK